MRQPGLEPDGGNRWISFWGGEGEALWGHVCDEELSEAELNVIRLGASPAAVPGLSAIGLIALASILLAGAVLILQRRPVVNRMA